MSNLVDRLVQRALSSTADVLLNQMLPVIDEAVVESTQPFTQPEMLKPHQYSRRYGWTHFGIFFPLLPAPHQYLNIMTLLGLPGALAFDNDALIQGGKPRDTATVFSTTAGLGADYLLKGYSMSRECDFAEDGSRLCFGDDLIITGHYPHYHALIKTGGLTLDVAITCTDQVSWFVNNPVYTHLSLLSHFEGTLTYEGKTEPVSGMCTFEHAASSGLHTLWNKPIPPAFKLPLDFFTYQIINLDEMTQLLLTDVSSCGHRAFRGVHIRTTDGAPARVYAEDVSFEVSAAQEVTTPTGASMRLPQTLHWQVRHEGQTILDITGHVDTAMRYGHGIGYAGGYTFTGTYEGRAVSGRGYLEYVDCR